MTDESDRGIFGLQLSLTGCTPTFFLDEEAPLFNSSCMIQMRRVTDEGEIPMIIVVRLKLNEAEELLFLHTCPE